MSSVPDLHLVVVLDLGHDLHRGKAGLPAGVGIKGRHPDQPVDAVLALQKAVGVLALDGDGRGFDARLVAVLIVQDLIGEVVALRPAGVHPVEHLGPVLGLGAAGAGMEGQDGVVAVVLPGEERGHPGLLDLLLQGLETGLQLFQQLLILRLLAHLAQGRQILPLGHQLVLAGDLVLQLLEALLHLLGSLQVVPEAVLGSLVLQLSGLPRGRCPCPARRRASPARAPGPGASAYIRRIRSKPCALSTSSNFISHSIISEERLFVKKNP